jgi:hypothetical protein
MTSLSLSSENGLVNPDVRIRLAFGRERSILRIVSANAGPMSSAAGNPVSSC